MVICTTITAHLASEAVTPDREDMTSFYERGILGRRFIGHLPLIAYRHVAVDPPKKYIQQRGRVTRCTLPSAVSDYQLAFVTPGIRPFEAISRN